VALSGETLEGDELDEDEIEQALFRSIGPTHLPLEDTSIDGDEDNDDDIENNDYDDGEDDDFLDDDMSTDNSDGFDMVDSSESSSLGGEEIPESPSSKSKRKSKRASISKTVKFTGSTFASAEEFAHLLEDNSNHDELLERRDDRSMWKGNMYSRKRHPSSKKRFKSSHHQ
jgi:hypothetical protein